MCVACQYLCVHMYAVLILMCILVQDRESQRSCFTSHFSPYFFELEYLINPEARLVARQVTKIPLDSAGFVDTTVVPSFFCEYWGFELRSEGL